MGKLNRTCIICGTKYKYCSSCSDKKLAVETWRNIYCSEKCKETFTILENFTAKKITADDVAVRLKDIGVDIDKISSKFAPTINIIKSNRTKTKVSVNNKKNKKKRNNIVNVD